MTTATIAAIVAIMRVILDMATDAGDIKLVGEWFVAVAIGTGQAGMTPQQQEVSIAGVIKTGSGPVERVMAVLALLAATALVNVIGRVATVARGVRRFEYLALVTIKAASVGMFAQQ